MRKPKQLTALLLALTLLFACAACGSGNSTTDSGKTISGTLPEIIDRLYDTVDVDDEQRDFLKNSVGTVEIPKDQSAYYFGVENLDFEEAVASEPFINAIAFSVCLMRVKDGTDIDELKAEIRRSANPAKWICVQADDLDAAVSGDLVLFVMIGSQFDLPAADLIGAFKTLCGGTLDKELSK